MQEARHVFDTQMAEVRQDLTQHAETETALLPGDLDAITAAMDEMRAEALLILFVFCQRRAGQGRVTYGHHGP